MSNYMVEIKGDNSLPNIELAIAGEEATGAKFLHSNISFHAGAVTNLVTFEDLPAGQRPKKPLLLAKHGEPVPDGCSTVWAGVMLVSGSNLAVIAAR